MSMVTAVAVSANLIMAARRDKRLAAGTKEVAVKAAEVATAVVEVKKELSTSKDEVAAHRLDEATIFGNIQKKVDATHIIVNAQKTAMMQKVTDAQFLTLTMAKAMLRNQPHDEELKSAVIAAQALYEQSMKDLQIKRDE